MRWENCYRRLTFFKDEKVVRKNPDESYEEWASRAKMYEHGWAMQRIAEGKPIEEVMDEMSRRLVQKLLHPIYDSIHNTVTTKIDIEASKKEYAEKYLNKRSPVADHVEGTIFDNRE